MRDLNCQNVEVDEIWGFVSNRLTDWILRQDLATFGRSSPWTRTRS